MKNAIQRSYATFRENNDIIITSIRGFGNTICAYTLYFLYQISYVSRKIKRADSFYATSIRYFRTERKTLSAPLSISSLSGL